MEVFITESEGTMTARLVGRLDTPAAASDMTYISSSGLRIFLTIRKAASSAGGHVVIQGLSNEIRQVFMMTGFLQLFEIK